MAEITKICLTGGPCAGKTSALPVLRVRLQLAGYHVVIVPEMATLMLSNGISLSGHDEGTLERIQRELLVSMIQLEESFVAAATAMGKKTVVICDRGTMDISSFVSPESWFRIRSPIAGNHSLRERYHAVFHLVTAAEGAENSYTQEIAGTGATRAESPERAREVDRLTKAAWTAHPYVIIIENRTFFQDKVDDLTDAVMEFLKTK